MTTMTRNRRPRAPFIDAMRDRLQAVRGNFDRASSTASRLPRPLRRRLAQRLESLHHKRDTLESKLTSAERAPAQRFERVRSELDTAWSELVDQWRLVDRQLSDVEES